MGLGYAILGLEWFGCWIGAVCTMTEMGGSRTAENTVPCLPSVVMVFWCRGVLCLELPMCKGVGGNDASTLATMRVTMMVSWVSMWSRQRRWCACGLGLSIFLSLC